MALYTEVQGELSDTRPALVLMHFLGGSGREWDEVVALLGDGYRTIRIDLPGFGGSAGETGYGVEAMADAVHEVLAGLKHYVLVGHSMSGKLALLLARREVLLPAKAIAGLVLVAPSPPGPEPMGDDKRSMMLGLLGERHEDDAVRARNYITKNEQRDIPQAVEQRATREVLRMNRAAWVAWLQHGSKEDWTERVGVLGIPAVLVAGEKDLSLGPKQQRETTMMHLGNARLVTLKDCSHLVPMERPEEMAAILREFVDRLPHATVPADYLSFIEGERLSVRTRQVLEDRMVGVVRPQGLLTAMQERTLRAVLARVVPGTGIDLARIIMARLATGKGDGWRYDVLPADATAYREGLDRLAAKGFEDLTAAEQDEALEALAAGPGSPEALWFEELRGDAASAYVAHPQTSARMGFSGPGVGGAFTRYRGFVELGINSRESWEPVPEPFTEHAQ
jgi:pimeloyl-ACP methyl ester carboxylesterase